MLMIIGLEVSLESMTISMSTGKHEDLIEAIKNFLNNPANQHPLRDWQRILGYCNWGLNTYPLLRPALQSSYAKLKGKKIPLVLIRLNKQVMRDLTWFAHHISISSGVHFFEAQGWVESEANLTLLSNASRTGLAFWVPELNVGFVSTIEDSDIHYGDIFFNEVLAVVSVIESSPNLPKRPQRILVHSDLMNTVDMFNTLTPEPPFVLLMIWAVEIMMDHGVDIRVVHIPGVENHVADALSRSLLDATCMICPDLKISSFKPP